MSVAAASSSSSNSNSNSSGGEALVASSSSDKPKNLFGAVGKGFTFLGAIGENLVSGGAGTGRRKGSDALTESAPVRQKTFVAVDGPEKHPDRAWIDKFLSEEAPSFEQRSAGASSTSNEPLCAIPADDIAYVTAKRSFSTASNPIPDDMKKDKVPAHVQLYFDSLEGDFKRVDIKSAKHGGGIGFARVPEPNPPVIKDEDMPTHPEKNPYPSGLSKHMLQQFTEIEERQRRAQLHANVIARGSMFDVYDPRKREVVPSDSRVGEYKFATQAMLSILVEAVSLKFTFLNGIEPFFLSIAFYDAQRKEKVSETWHFDFNSSSQLTLIGRTANEKETKSKKAIFQMYQPSPDIFCVVRLDKVMSGAEMDAVVEPYVKGVSNVEKFKEKAQMNAGRLQKFLQPFAFGVLPLYEGGTMALKETLSVPLTKVRSDFSENFVFDSIQKSHYQAQKSGGFGRSMSTVAKPQRLLPIELLLRFTKQRLQDLETLENAVTSVYLPLKPFKEKAAEVVRTMDAFAGDPGELRRPLSFFVHTLYVSPLSLNFNRHPNSSSRNIVLAFSFHRHDGDPTCEPAEAVIYGRSSTAALETRQFTSGVYHNTRPNFFNEDIKIRLPTDLQPGDHVVVSFYHVSCKEARSKKDATARGLELAAHLGRAYIPIFEGHRIIDDGEHSLPVATHALPNYLNPSLLPGAAGAQAMKYVDNGKPVFTYRTRVVSGLQPQSRPVERFMTTFSLCCSSATSSPSPSSSSSAVASSSSASQPLSTPRTPRVDPTPSGLLVAIKELSGADSCFFVQYFPALFQTLLGTVYLQAPNIGAQAMLSLSNAIDAVNNSVPETISRFKRNQMVEAETLHVFDPARFLKSLSQAGAPIPKVSLHQKILQTFVELLGMNRQAGVGMAMPPPDVATALKHCWYWFDVMIKSIMSDLAKQKKLSPVGNRDGRLPDEIFTLLEKFLIEGLAKLIQQQAYSEVAQEVNGNVALLLKDLLRVADRHRVLRLLTLYMSSLDPTNKSQHIVAMKMEALWVIADYEHFVAVNLPTRQQQGVPLTAEEVSQLQQTLWKRHPFIGLLLTEVSNCAGSRNPAVRTAAVNLLRKLLWKHNKDERYASREPQEAIAGMYFPVVDIVVRNSAILAPEGDATESERQDWMICFLYVLKHCSHANMLLPYWHHETQKTVVGFLRSLELLVHAFDDVHQVREVSFVVLDVLETFFNDRKGRLLVPDNPLMRPAFDALIATLAKRQTVYFLGNAFRTLKWFTYIFAKTLFEYPDPYYCGELCYHLLRYTNVDNGLLQAAAGALWWVLIQVNHAVRKNFARMKLQSTIAISRLAKGQTASYKPLLEVLANVDKNAKQTFGASAGAELKDLSKRLHQVVEDSVRIAQYRFDPEMTCDLFYQVSLGYQNSPDLRITRLENLAEFHVSRQRWEEAAQCKIFMASLVFAYLKAAGLCIDGMPLSAQALAPASPEVLNEAGLPDINPAQAGEEGIYQNKLFSVQGFWELIRDVSTYLKRGSYYEIGLEVGELFTELHQANRNYQGLGNNFRALQGLAMSIESGERLFSRYYRISFVGEKWDAQLKGQEYIYKEKNNVVFVQILKDRLINQFGKKYGPSNVVMLPNTIQLNTPQQRRDAAKGLEPNKVYFQIVSVTPFLTKEEVAERQTTWERCFNLRRFSYSVPFTTDGSKPSEDMSKQCTRKTILTVEKAFPYVKPRLRIISREIVELSPIENATGMIQEKIASMQIATMDARNAAAGIGLRSTKEASNVLQQQLQGSVLTMVNAGPVAIASIFLGKWREYPAHQVQALRVTLKEFLLTIKAALNANTKVISPELIPFQEECEKAFGRLKSTVSSLLKNSEAAAKK